MDDDEERLVFVPLEVSIVSVMTSPLEDGSVCVLLVLFLSSLLLTMMCVSCQIRSRPSSYPVIVEAEPVSSKV